MLLRQVALEQVASVDDLRVAHDDVNPLGLGEVSAIAFELVVVLGCLRFLQVGHAAIGLRLHSLGRYGA